MQQIAAHSDASFIVIGDRQGFICFIPSIRSGLARGWSAATTRRYWKENHTTIRKGGLGVSLRSSRSLMTQGE